MPDFFAVKPFIIWMHLSILSRPEMQDRDFGPPVLHIVVQFRHVNVYKSSQQFIVAEYLFLKGHVLRCMIEFLVQRNLKAFVFLYTVCQALHIMDLNDLDLNDLDLNANVFNHQT